MSDDRLQMYRDRLAAGQGLLAREWDHFDALEKQLEPEAYAERQTASLRRVAMDYARKLTTADLEAVLSERHSPELSNEVEP